MEYFLVRYDSRVVIYERKTFIRLATAWCWLGWGSYGDIGGILSRVFIVNTLNFMTDALLWWNGLDCTAHNIVKNELPFLNTKLMNFQIKTIQRRCRESEKAIFSPWNWETFKKCQNENVWKTPFKMTKKVSSPPTSEAARPRESRISRPKLYRILSIVSTFVGVVFVVCLVTGIYVVNSDDTNGDVSDPAAIFDAFVSETGESAGIVKREPQTRFDRQGFSLGGKTFEPIRLILV